MRRIELIQKPSKLAGFIYIDRCCEGIGWSRPNENEEYIAIPHGYYDVGAMGCIEIYKSGKLTYSVNIADVSCVEFLQEKPNA